MKCLDTTFFVDLLRKKDFAVEKGKKIKEDVLVTTSINLFEVYIGLFREKPFSADKLETFMKMIEAVDILDFDVHASLFSAKISAELLHKGQEINISDCQIAGTMLSQHCKTIVTNDAAHFRRIKGITVETY
ncbi:MAG: type II toxin-antitoxin system VapC family toxin [Nanoarchaeota archaeon]